MNKPLPIAQIFFESVRRPFVRYRELVRLCAPYIAVDLAPSFLDEDVELTTGVTVMYSLLLVAVSVLAAVGCHRTFLLSYGQVRSTSVMRWRATESQFLLYVFVIWIMGSLISALLAIPINLTSSVDIVTNVEAGESAIPGFTAMLILLPAYYCMARWSILLPATAIDDRRSLSWAWNASRPYAFSLFVLVGALPLAAYFILNLLLAPMVASIAGHLVYSCAWLIIAAIEICLLSLSYEWIVSRQPEGVDEADAADDPP